MSASVIHATLTQVRQIVNKLGAVGLPAVFAELKAVRVLLTDLYGDDARLYVLHVLLDEVDFFGAFNQAGAQNAQHVLAALKRQLCAEVCSELYGQPNATQLLTTALQTRGVSLDLLVAFTRVCQLSLPAQCALALALVSSPPTEAAARDEGIAFLKLKFGELADPSHQRLLPAAARDVLLCARGHPGVSPAQTRALVNSMRSIYPDAVAAAGLAGGHDDFASQRRPFSSADELGVSTAVCDAVYAAGYMCAESAPLFRATVATALTATKTAFGESECARLICMLARTHARHLYADSSSMDNAGWRLAVIIPTLQQMFPSLQWAEVFRRFDHVDLFIPDARAFSVLLDMWRLATATAAGVPPFPLTAMLFPEQPYRSAKGHLSLLRAAMQSPPETGVDFLLFSPRALRSVPAPPFDGSNELNLTVQGPSNHCWCSVDLVESLLNLSEVAPAEVFISIRSLFRSPLDVCPDVLACTLALARPRGATLQEELLAQLAPAFLPPPASYDSRSGVVGSPASLHAVLVRLWQLSPGFLVRAALRAHIDDRAFAARALDIAVAMRVVLGTAAADPLAALLDVKLAALSADVKPYLAFALDVATLASRREVALPGTPLSSPPTLALEAWLRRRLHENGNLFALACIDFLRENMTRAQQSAVTGRPAVNVCAPETVVVFFKVLFAAQGLLSPELQNELSVFFGACAQANPQLLATAAAQQQQSQMQPPALVQPTQMQAPVPAAAPAAAPAGSVSEVEDEANSYFQKLYTSAVSIDEAVSMLKRFQQSGVVREREVFACMIHNLFDEFQFFAKYPEKELKITATLMGALLSNQMLLPSAALPAAPIPTVLQAAVSSPLSASSGSVSLHLGLALRCVLEALRKPADSKLFRFGKWALEGCEKRLGDWPPFCALLMPLAHLHAVYPQLVELLNRGMLQAQAVDPASMALLSATLSCPFEVFQQTMISGTAWSPSQSSKAANAAAAAVVQAVVNNVPTLARPSEAEPKEVSNGLPVYVKPPAPPLPDEATQDRLTFLINSLGKNNVETKARELRSFIKPEHLYFLAHDLMFKRVSVETNLHALYLTFLDAIKMDELRDHLIDAVQSSIRALLSSDKILQSMGERTLLKSLGSFLGKLTLSRNRPILARSLDLRALILDAFDRGRLIAVIPFVTKILECCKNSRVFRLPNPWMAVMLGLLSEIYNLPELKLTLKFEVEVLFNNLSIKMKDVKPTQLLVGRVIRDKNAAQNFRDERSVSGIITGDEHAASSGLEDDNKGASVGADAALVIAPSIALFVKTPTLRRLVPHAIDRAINEVITPVVERSVNVACITTRELVTKDFAMEPDEHRMRAAAHQMVSALTGSLAQVTCKDSLRVAIANHLRTLLQANISNADAQTTSAIDAAANQVASDNVDLGCSIIEKAASERAIREIDEALANAYGVRRTHRAQTGQPYFDMSIFTPAPLPQPPQPIVAGQPPPPPQPPQTSRFPAALPDLLRPKPSPSGVAREHLRMYEDFGRVAAAAAQALVAATAAPSAGAPAPAAGAVPAQGAAAAPPAALVNNNVPQLVPPQPQQQPQGGIANVALAAALVKPGASAGQNGQNLANALLQSTGNEELLPGPLVLEKLQEACAQIERLALRFQMQGATTLANLVTDPTFAALLLLFARLLHRCPAQVPQVAGAPQPSSPRDEVAAAFGAKVLRRLAESRSAALAVELFISVLKSTRLALFAQPMRFSRDLTQHWFSHAVLPEGDDVRFNRDLVVPLLRERLLSVADLDAQLAKAMLAGAAAAAAAAAGQAAVVPNIAASLMELAVVIVRQLVLTERALRPQELPHTLDTLRKLAQRGKVEPLVNFLQQVDELAAQTAEPIENKSAVPADDSGAALQATAVAATTVWYSWSADNVLADTHAEAQEAAVKGVEASELVRRHLLTLLEHWMGLLSSSTEKGLSQFLSLLEQQGLVKTEENLRRVFRVWLEIAIESAFTNADTTSGLNYTLLDGLTKLLVFLVKYVTSPVAPFVASETPTPNKVTILSAYLYALTRVVLRDAPGGRRGGAPASSAPTGPFNQRPYFRAFVNVLHECSGDAVSAPLDSNVLGVLAGVVHALLACAPARAPAFAFAWLELAAHRSLMPRLLGASARASGTAECSRLVERMLVACLRFMEPFLRSAEPAASVQQLHKGVMRVFLVLLHDFPEFLCEHHAALCEALPSNAVQLRNLILSAFPRTQRLPDPFTPNLKVDLLPEIAQQPKLVYDVAGLLTAAGLKADIDSYLVNRQASVRELVARSASHLTPAVLYVGMQGIAQLQAGAKTSGVTLASTSAMELLRGLVYESATAEARFGALNAIVNQLRYPNAQTHYFSCVTLALFADAPNDGVREQVARVLVERLIVHKPHPWGLLVTFIELVKNPRYDFFSHAFVRASPEIEHLFDSVTRACLPSNAAEESPNAWAAAQ